MTLIVKGKPEIALVHAMKRGFIVQRFLSYPRLGDATEITVLDSTQYTDKALDWWNETVTQKSPLPEGSLIFVGERKGSYETSDRNHG